MKPKKNTIVIITVILVVMTAFAIRLVNRMDSVQEPVMTDFIRITLHIGLFTAWGFSLFHRIIQKNARHFLCGIAFLMVLWLCFKALKYYIVTDINAARYLWYLYYLPLLFIPLFTLFAALFLGKTENYRLPRWTKLLYFFAVLLLVMVMTNDCHQFVFRFPEDAVEFSVEEGYPSTAEPNITVTLYAGYPKQDKLEEIIQHGVELGCARFIPFFSRYCVAAPKKEEQKNTRYNRIAAEAAKQCGRGILPKVCMPLKNFAAVCADWAQYDLVLFFYECGGESLHTLLKQLPEKDNGDCLKIAVVTGSEGGFAAEEAQAAAQAGAKTVGLGPRILRCETAPLAALSAIMTLTGNLE